MHGLADDLVGLWRRLSIVDADGEMDSETEVYWLQSHGLYIDLRLPPERPDFTGVCDIEHMRAEQIDWMARVQGFAGRLSLEGDIASWQRDLDIQPPSAVADVGRLERRGNAMTEYGVLADYTEEWERTPLEDERILALKLLREENDDGVMPRRPGFLVCVGNHFMFALGRHSHLPKGTDLASLLAAEPGNLERRRVLLSCTIEFGICAGGARPWEIQRSSHPWREGMSLLEYGCRVVHRHGSILDTRGTEGTLRQWEVLEDHGEVLSPASVSA